MSVTYDGLGGFKAYDLMGDCNHYINPSNHKAYIHRGDSKFPRDIHTCLSFLIIIRIWVGHLSTKQLLDPE